MFRGILYPIEGATLSEKRKARVACDIDLDAPSKKSIN